MLAKFFKVTVFAVLIAWIALHYRSAGVAPANHAFVESGMAQSVWNDFLTRYNLIAQLRDRKQAVEHGQPPGEDAQKRATPP